MRRIIITVAPTGGTSRTDRNPALPTQPGEIAEDVYRCWQAGAAVAALHARRPDGEATCNAEIYQHINQLVRQRCDIIINNSTGGGTNGDMLRDRQDGRKEVSFEERLKATEAGADMCTFGPQTTSITADGIEMLMETSWSSCLVLASRLQERHIKPEWEVYSPGDLLLARRLIGLGFDKPPHYFNIVLGADQHLTGTLPYTPQILQRMVDDLPRDSVFAVTAFGRAHIRAVTQGLILGGHLRVGLEDTLYFGPGDLATNVRLVERAVRLIEELGLEVATSSEAREMLGLPQGVL